VNIKPELRIGDAERESAAAALGEHFASGRLTREEYDERSTSVWSAKTRSDLWPLFADLPSPHVEHRSAVVVPVTTRRHDGGGSSRGRRRGGFPLVVVMVALVVILVALPGPPWPLFVLGWFWMFGLFRWGWFGWGRRSHPRRG